MGYKLLIENDEGEHEGLKAIRLHEDCLDIDEEKEAQADLIRKYENPKQIKMINEIEHKTEATRKEDLLFKQQKEYTDLKLSHEQINYIIQQLNYEIEQNEDLINNLKDKKEIASLKDNNNFIKNLIIDLKPQDKTITQLVLQGLTKEQEDYLIESQMEYLREMKEEKYGD